MRRRRTRREAEASPCGFAEVSGKLGLVHHSLVILRSIVSLDTHSSCSPSSQPAHTTSTAKDLLGFLKYTSKSLFPGGRRN